MDSYTEEHIAHVARQICNGLHWIHFKGSVLVYKFFPRFQVIFSWLKNNLTTINSEKYGYFVIYAYVRMTVKAFSNGNRLWEKPKYEEEDNFM